jgi:hypothetical protein
MATEFKECRKCGENKPVSEFPVNRKLKDGYDSWCKLCHRESHREYQKNIPKEVQYARTKASTAKNPLRVRASDWKRQGINITREQYLQMHEEQQGRCAICGRTEEEIGRKFDVDHCHEGSTIRGLVCKQCNLMLGYARNNPQTLRKAADYLTIKKEDYV